MSQLGLRRLDTLLFCPVTACQHIEMFLYEYFVCHISVISGDGVMVAAASPSTSKLGK